MPPTRSKRATQTLAVQAVELAFAVPQVVAHRVTRMALSGPDLSPRDRKEFTRMVAEKNAAFAASWQAMALHAAASQPALAATFVRNLFSAAAGKRPSAAASASQFGEATAALLGKGLGPVHRTAVANAKRLARTRLR